MNHPVWIEVERAALEHNLLQVKGLVGPAVKICAVVKADAYGHGAVESARIFVSTGANMLAVTRVDEALELRKNDITAPILVLDSSPVESAQTIVEYDLQQTLCTRELASALSSAASGTGRTARVHVKVDTGMGRLGLLPEDVPEFVRYLTTLPGIEVAGTYTHFAKALESGLGPTRQHYDRFIDVLDMLKQQNLPVGVTHAANSAAIIRLPESRLDMVRPGTILYGQYPSSSVPRQLELRNGWTLKARISFLKTVPAGFSIGYGGEFTTKR
jgi:alanine racemase